MDAYFQSWEKALGENTTVDFAITTTVQVGSNPRWNIWRWFRSSMQDGSYPLVNFYKKLWKITIFNGKTHYKSPFSIAMLNYQRVNHKSTCGHLNWASKKHGPKKSLDTSRGLLLHHVCRSQGEFQINPSGVVEEYGTTTANTFTGLFGQCW